MCFLQKKKIQTKVNYDYRNYLKRKIVNFEMKKKFTNKCMAVFFLFMG